MSGGLLWPRKKDQLAFERSGLTLSEWLERRQKRAHAPKRKRPAKKDAALKKSHVRRRRA